MVGQEHTGTEPTQARSPLRLRAWMSAVMLVLTIAAATLLAAAALSEDTPGERRGLVVAAGIALAVAVVAAVDLVVVLRRIRHGDHG